MKAMIKTISTIAMVALVGIANVNCGKINTDVDDAAQTIADAFDEFGNAIEDGVSDAEDALDGDDDSDTSGTEVGDHTEEGIEITSTPASDSERESIGIFTKKNAIDDCSYFPLEYDTPAVIEGFEHLNSNDNAVDFENSKGQLIWIARVVADTIFNFSVFYSKSLSASIELACTCDLDAAYYSYLPETISCTCEDDDGEVCGLKYERLDEE